MASCKNSEQPLAPIPRKKKIGFLVHFYPIGSILIHVGIQRLVSIGLRYLAYLGLPRSTLVYIDIPLSTLVCVSLYWSTLVYVGMLV